MATTRDDIEVPVLIVGGGPAGLTMALELAQRGIDGLVIDRRNFTARYPRAHLLNVRTMEAFEDVGVAGDIYALSPPEDQWHRVAWYTSLAGPTPLHGRRIGYVDAWGGGEDLDAYRRASPRAFANLPQIRLDQLLLDHAERQWPGRIVGRQELVGIRNEDHGAVATVKDLDTGQNYRIRARYVIGADGGRTIGELIGAQMVGPRALMDLVNVYFSADLSAYADEEALLTYFINPEGHGTFAGALLGLGPEKWGKNCAEWSVGVAFHTDDPASLDEAALITRVREMIGVGDLEIDVHAIGHWQFEGVVADRFRVGSVFLIGDAAHRHPPTGGLGLNTAIGDVSNLAWKLDAVLRGYAGDDLLDTYEIERQAIAAQNVAHSLNNAGRHRPVAEALGLHKDIGADEGWREIGIWASDTAEGVRRRAAAADAVAANADDFSQLNIEAGFAYEFGAVLPDGSPPPPTSASATEFTATSRPGHHIPHVWLDRAGEQISSSDLVARQGFTLFIGNAATEEWRAAASQVQQNLECPITVIEVGHGAPITDPVGLWGSAREVTATGALLVRPDRHVAWRTAEVGPDVAATLTRVVGGLLRGEVQGTAPSVEERVAKIAEAGAKLHTGRTSRPALFNEVS